MYDTQHTTILMDAMSQLERNLHRRMPAVSEQIVEWFRYLAGGHEPSAYFQHPRAYPFLLYPWWFENRLTDTPDIEFQTDLAYSSINAYYYIRLFDNVMDGDITVETKLLPATVFFHHELHLAYQKQFDHDHPFWEFFITTWLQMSEASMQDMELTHIDEVLFKKIVSVKVCAAKIPIAAVCYKYHHPDQLQQWSRFIDLFGCWHQMQEDLFDWQEDSQKGKPTYFLSVAEAQKRSNETITAWVICEGIDWGVKTLKDWMAEMREIVTDLAIPELNTYLVEREQTLDQQIDKIRKGLTLLQKLLEADNTQND